MHHQNAFFFFRLVRKCHSPGIITELLVAINTPFSVQKPQNMEFNEKDTAKYHHTIFSLPYRVLRDGFGQQLTSSKTASPMDWQNWTWHKLKKHTKNLTRYPTIFANSRYKHTDRHFQCNEAEKKKIRTHGKTYEQLGKPWNSIMYH